MASGVWTNEGTWLAPYIDQSRVEGPAEWLFSATKDRHILALSLFKL